MRLVVIALALALALPLAAANAADWKQYRGPNGDGSSGDAAINLNWTAKPPALLWSIALADGGWSNPCVAEGKVFVVDHKNTEGPKDAKGKPTVEKGEDIVRALDAKTGKEDWNTPYPGSKQDKNGYTGSSPVFDSGKIYTIGRFTMQAYCLDAKTGKPVWTRDLEKDFAARPPEKQWGLTGSPLVYENKVIIIAGGANAAVVALDKNSGQTLWQTPGSAAGYSTPMIFDNNGKAQVAVYIAEGLFGIDPATGKRLWTFPRPIKHNQNSATPIPVGKRLLISSAWDVGTALVDVSGAAPSLVWESKELQARFSTPVYLKGAIYGVSMPENPGTLVCLDAATGAVKWKQPGFQFGPLSTAGGALLAVNGKTGEVVLVEANAAAYKEIARLKPAPEATAWNHPIVADGRMFLRNKKTLFCYNVAP